jgi:broad-specificity NMP kinase
MKNTLIVNFFGGPGTGKSTFASGVFSKLKHLNYNVEYVQEFAKKLTWEKNNLALDNQFYVSGTQSYFQNMLIGQVDAVITDSPLLIGLLYYREKN